MSEISTPHKGTIIRHLQECTQVGVPLGQIHQELVEIFCGKYSIHQITAFTSWRLGQSLKTRLVNEVQCVEGPDTSEDIDFNTPDKILSREWHFGNIVKHTSADQRHAMRLLLMPGRNTFDLEAAQKAGIQGSNLLTYIRGDVPDATAEYVRNARQFGVLHRRIGDMEQELPQERQTIHAAYLDFFGQICRGYIRILESLPLDPNSKILLGLNVMRGREHATTKRNMYLVHHLLQERPGTMEQVSDGLRAGDISIDDPMGDIRESGFRSILSASVGAARVENWIFKDEVRTLMHAAGYAQFDAMNNHEKLQALTATLSHVARLFLEKRDYFLSRGVYVDLGLLTGVCMMAVENLTKIRSAEEPFTYVSPNGNRPFISNFVVLETMQKEYLRYADAIDFVLKVATCVSGNLNKSNAPTAPIGAIQCIGDRGNKEVRWLDVDERVVATANHDYLLEACTMLYEDGNVNFLKDRDRPPLDKQAVLREKIAEAHRGGPRPFMQRLPIVNTDSHVGRNDLCPCGSGRKFKKCCNRNQ